MQKEILHDLHAIAESEERLKMALKVAGLGYFDWQFAAGKLHWDDKMCELHGLSADASIDKLEYLYGILHPEDRNWLPDRVADAIQPEQEVLAFGRDYRIELDGEIRYIQVKGSFFRDPSGAVQRVIGTAQNVTAQKQAEAQLERTQRELCELNERFEISTRTARLGIWEWHVQTDALFWDETMFSIYGITREQFTGKTDSWQRSLHPEDQQDIKRALVLVLKDIQPLDTEFRILRPDGAIRYIRVMASVQRDGEGRAVRVIGANWDITKEKEAERQKIKARQLELKNKELEQFAYAASHDLQEPLHTVQGFVDVLKRRLGERLDEQSIEFLDLIGNSTHRMSKLIRALLDYSMVGVQEKMTEVDTHTLVRELIEDLATPINAAGARVEVEPLPVLPGYEAGLRVLFQNLISNAVKFRRHAVQPFVRISVRDDGDHWAFCVADNGIGIAKKHQHRIFGIFQRLHPTSEYSGTGIGLSHCRKIVELHGGQIWVESMPDVGSSFYFTLAR